MADALISRVYSITVAGYEASLKNIKALTAAIKALDKQKQDADASLRQAIELGNSEAITRLTAKVKELQTALSNLEREKAKAVDESKVLADQTRQRILDEKASQEQLKTQKLKNQESEVTQKKIDREDKATEKLNSAYNQLNARYKIHASIAQEMGAKYGYTSEQFKLAAERAHKLHAELLTIDVGVGKSQRNVGAYGNAIHSVNQVMRETPSLANGLRTYLSAIGNNVPQMVDEFKKLSGTIDDNTGKAVGGAKAFKIMAGAIFSWGSLLTVILTILPIIANGMSEMFSSMAKGSKAVLDQKQAMADLNEEIKSTGKNYSEAVVGLEILNDRVRKGGKSFAEKQDILKDYNAQFGTTLGVAKSYNDVEQLLRDKTGPYIEAMKLRAQAQAAHNLAIKENEQILNTQLEGEHSIKNLETTRQQAIKDKTLSGDRIKEYNRMIENQKTIIQNEIIQNSVRKKFFEERFTQLTLEADKIDKTTKVISDPEKSKTKTNKVSACSKLSGEEKDALKIIEARRDQELATENLRVAKLREVRALNIKEEKEHIIKLQSISDAADKQKIAAIRGFDATDRKERARLDLDIINRRVDTNKKLQDLNQKAFEDQSALLKKTLEQQTTSINFNTELIQTDPRISEENKATAKQAADNKIIDLTTAYYDQLNALAATYNVQSESSEEERIKVINDLKKAALNDDVAIAKARLADLEAEGARQVQQVEVNYSKLRKAVLDNDKLSRQEKEKQITLLDQAEQRTILSAELETLTKQVVEKDRQLKAGLISNDEYLKAVADQIAKAEDLSKTAPGNIAPVKGEKKSIAELIQGGRKSTGGLRKALNVKEGSDEDDTLASTIPQVLSQSYALAQSAMQSYFDSEKERVQQSKQLAYERIDLEKQQLLARAQSQAERDSIEAQAAEKKKKADREAGEQVKRIKKSEAKMSLASELAAIAVSAAQNPLNGLTFGATGIAMYAVLAGLALARYAMNLKNINAATFEKGGTLSNNRWSKVLGRGGQFEGNSHAQGGNKFMYDDMPVETEKGEAYIINKRSTQSSQRLSVQGTPREIASAINEFGGGVRFASGARLQKLEFGGTLGRNLQPPINPGSYIRPANSNGAEMTKLLEAINDQRIHINALADQTNKRIDNLKVQVVAKEVVDMDNKIRKATSIGSLNDNL